jgi:hypothetical protein
MIYAYFGIRYPIIFGFSEVVSSPLVRKNLDRVSFSYIKKRVKKRKKINWAFARETAFSQARSLKLLVDCSGLELGVAILQAYVFTILICIYLNDAINLH